MKVGDRHFWLGLLAGAALVLPGSPAYALGLGEANVRSYMRQPLDVRIRLISRSEAELATVTANLASAEDFRIIGLDREMISMPLEFFVNADLDDPYVHIRSRLPVNDPVVQLVVEVVWSSGRMLRQYTLFLDPPTFDSAAPLPKPSAAPEESDLQESEDLIAAGDSLRPEADRAGTEAGPPFEPEPEVAVENGGAAATSRDPDSLLEPPEQETATTPSEPESLAAKPDPTEREPLPDTETQDLTPEPVQADSKAEPEPPAFRAVMDDPERTREVYGPVQRGQTLWGIASRWGREHGYATNQVMLAIQQQNPGAFLRNNINLLKRGAILRMPTFAEINTWDARQAMLEVLRQEDQFLNRRNLPAEPADIPAVAHIAAEPERAALADGAAEVPREGRLELVPPTGPDGGAEAGLGQGNSDDSGGSNGESVVEELARTQEELANAEQENDYLNERIRELEEELARRETTGVAKVEDTGLADMEQRLREERLSENPDEPQVAIVPPREDEPWYAGFGWWLAGLLLLIVAALVWWLRRRAPAEPPEETDENELEAAPDPAPEGGEEGPTVDDNNVVALDRFKSTAKRVRSLHQTDPEEEAVELDSDDPETKLDLARAYISMGDADAARAILEDVTATGNEDQIAEAQSMLEEL